MKQCTKCKKWKSLSAFSKDKNDRYNLRADCKECEVSRVQKYCKVHKTERTKYYKEYRRTLAGYLYRRFQDIKRRCNNLKCVAYKNYGGRSIECKFKSVDEFINYVTNELCYDTYEKIKGLQIDRIDNDGHYESGNIRFVTRSENNKNKRSKK